MKFYIAGRLEKADFVRLVRDSLIHDGHQITYDWTIAGSVRDDADRLRAVAGSEIQGVATADVMVVLLPGGRGTHAELGAALALGKPVVLWSGDKTLLSLGKETCAFYHHPLVSIVDSHEEIAWECARLFKRNSAQIPLFEAPYQC